VINNMNYLNPQPTMPAVNRVNACDGFANYPTFAVAVELKNDSKLLGRARAQIILANRQDQHAPSRLESWYKGNVIKLDSHDDHPLYSFASFALEFVDWSEVVEFLTQR
jgi:hypothetical protein